MPFGYIGEREMTPLEYKEEYRFMRHVFEIKYADYVNQAIRTIKDFPREARLSGDDSGLNSFWEEWAFQMQIGESCYFEIYVHTIENVCKGIVGCMPDHEIYGLWMFSENGYAPDDLEDLPDLGEMIEEVAVGLYKRICSIAKKEKLPDEAVRRYEETDDFF